MAPARCNTDDPQLALPGEVGEVLRELGVEELPHGADILTKRELRFVIELLQHGNLTKAATAAGYSEKAAHALASETLRKPKVFLFYQRCLAGVADKAGQLTKRVYERSVIFHAKTMEAAQVKAEADEMLLLSRTKRDAAKGGYYQRDYELARDRAQRDEKHYAALAHQADTLLATLLGKLRLEVSGSITHNHEGAVVLPAAALPTLAAMRQDARREGFIGGRS